VSLTAKEWIIENNDHMLSGSEVWAIIADLAALEKERDEYKAGNATLAGLAIDAQARAESSERYLDEHFARANEWREESEKQCIRAEAAEGDVRELTAAVQETRAEDPRPPRRSCQGGQWARYRRGNQP
jgi:hypothetical protein